MRYRLSTLFCVVVTLTGSTIAWAHEGHAHKVMGTVTMAAADHLMIKTTDGKNATITVNAKAKVLRGKTAIKLTDIEPGTRVVVTMNSEKAPLVATEVQVGPAGQPAAIASSTAHERN